MMQFMFKSLLYLINTNKKKNRCQSPKTLSTPHTQLTKQTFMQFYLYCQKYWFGSTKSGKAKLVHLYYGLIYTTLIKIAS